MYKFSYYNYVVASVLLMAGIIASVAVAMTAAVINKNPAYIALMIPLAALTTFATVFYLRKKVVVDENGLTVNAGRVISWADIVEARIGHRLDAEPTGAQRYKFGTAQNMVIRYDSSGRKGKIILDGKIKDYDAIRDLILSKVEIQPKDKFDSL